MAAREALLVSTSAVALAVAATWPLAAHLTTLVPHGGTDSTLNTWVLAWAADRLPFGLAGFWTPPAFYPYPNSLAYSENLLGAAIFVAPVRWAGGNSTLLYNAAFLLAYVVSAIGAYLLARDVTGSRAAAALGALAFVMMPYRIAQAGHLQVQWIGWMAIAFWALWRGLRQPSWTTMSIFVGASILQVLTNGYAAFQIALGAAIIVPWRLAPTLRRSPRPLLTVSAAAAIGLILLVPVLDAYQHVWADRAPATGEILENSADLGTYFSVPAGLPGETWLPGVAQPEGRLFPGVTVTALALLALLPAFGSRTRVVDWHAIGTFVTIGAVGVLVSLGPEPTAWGRALPLPSLFSALAERVPLFQIVRVPARFGALVLLAVSVLAAVGATEALGRMSRWRWLVVAGLAAAIFAEGYPPARAMRTGVPEPSADERQAYEWLAGQPEGALLELPIGGSGRVNFGLLAQHAALRHGHPVINGLTRLDTPLQELLGGSASPLAYRDGQAAVLPLLQALDVRYVIVRPSRFVDPDFAANTLQILQASPRVAGLRAFGDDVHVLWLAPDTAPVGAVVAPQPIPASAFALTASVNGDRLDWIVDGAPGTRWLTGGPQQGTEWVAASFDRPRDIARIEILLTARSLRDYPRHLRVESLEANGTTRVLFDGDVLAAMGRAIRANPGRPVMSIELPPNLATAVTLRQTGETDRWYWSIDDLWFRERQ